MFSHVRTEKTLFRLAHETMKKRKAKETKKKKKWGKQAKSAFYDTLSIFPREPANSSFRIFLKAIPSSSPTFFPLSLSLSPSFFFFLNRIQQKGTGCLAYVTYENERHSAGKTPSSSRMQRGCSVYHSILRSSDVPSDLQTARK